MTNKDGCLLATGRVSSCPRFVRHDAGIGFSIAVCTCQTGSRMAGEKPPEGCEANGIVSRGRCCGGARTTAG